MVKKYDSTFKKGCICGLTKQIHTSGLSLNEWKQYKILCEKGTTDFLVLKCVEEEQLLVVELFKEQKKDTRIVRINGKVFWARYSRFLIVQKWLMEPEMDKKLDNPLEAITGIYDSHNRFIRNRRKENDKCRALDEQWTIVLREGEKRRDEYYRMRAPMEEITVPDYLVQNAMHPYSGGGVNPR